MIRHSCGGHLSYVAFGFDIEVMLVCTPGFLIDVAGKYTLQSQLRRRDVKSANPAKQIRKSYWRMADLIDHNLHYP